MKVSRHPCQMLLSPLKPSTSLRPASPFQHLTSAFSYSSELFCTPQKLNSFLFKQFRTLSQKHPGVGVPLTFDFSFSLHSSTQTADFQTLCFLFPRHSFIFRIP